MNIQIDELASEIAKGLSEYSQDIVDVLNEKSAATAKEAVTKLKARSPKKTGKYARSWKVNTEKFHGEPDRHVIYNGKHYWLTHLLEFGHAKAGGGRVEGKPHIAPVEEETAEDFVRVVEEAIRHGV